jgi:hypothetical protein
MRSILLAAIIASVPRAAGLQAQVDYSARLGVTWATSLVHDVIVDEVDVRQKLAPTLALGAALPIAPLYQAGLELTLTSSGYRATEAGTSTDLGTIRSATVTLGLDGPIAQNFRWRAGTGIIGYWPSDDRGIFLQGGTTRFLAGAGVDYRRSIRPALDMIVSVRYDFHRFTTDELQTRGFSQSQGVQRVSATVGLARGKR